MALPLRVMVTGEPQTPSVDATLELIGREQVLARQTTDQAPDLRTALQQAFAQNPRLGPYVLDDQGHLRPNVMVFIDGQRCRERVHLRDPLRPDSTVHVMQALSGG